MRLLRNTTADGSCKYGLIRLDKMRRMPEDQQAAIRGYLEKLKAAGVFELAEKGSKEEVFCIKLKDIHAAPAFRAYATSVLHFDTELARDVFELSLRAFERKDARHPTV